jgi:CheY-like chemotaxis protein
MKNIKIFIVDDNAHDLQLLKDQLTLHEYSVVAANNGADALKQMQAEKPDLVILDINMPDMSGWKTCDQIRSDPFLSHIPILMCSAYIEDDGRFDAYQTGDGYIQKPVNLANLLTMIQELLDKKTRGTDAAKRKDSDH